MFRKPRWPALFVVLLLSGIPPLAQEKPQISVTVQVVNLLATVRDKHGQYVSNLGKDDFVLQEDKRPQAITYFSRETDLRLTLGLLIDTSGSQRRVLDLERTVSHNFLDEMLRQNDRAFVIQFDEEVQLLQDLTSSPDQLTRALDAVDDLHPDGTSLYDAIFLASDEVVRKQQGRKALIILSDGVDNGSQESLKDAIMAAQRSDVVVYSILFADQRLPSYGRGALGQISKETGGRLFEVSKKVPLDDIFTMIEEELRNQYSLGYQPASGAAPGYHKIHLETKQKDLLVQARDGYYADR